MEDEHKADMKKKDEEIEALRKEKEAISAKVSELSTKVFQSELPTRAEKLIAEKKLSETAAKYVKKKIAKFIPPAEEGKVDEAFGKFIEEKISEFEDIAKDVFGQESVKEKPRDGENTSGAETPGEDDGLTPKGLIK